MNDESVVVYSHPMSESGPSTTRLVDKDDPRSRLHFVKYLKRDGKTLKIWECGICKYLNFDPYCCSSKVYTYTIMYRRSHFRRTFIIQNPRTSFICRLKEYSSHPIFPSSETPITFGKIDNFFSQKICRTNDNGVGF